LRTVPGRRVEAALLPGVRKEKFMPLLTKIKEPVKEETRSKRSLKFSLKTGGYEVDVVEDRPKRRTILFHAWGGRSWRRSAAATVYRIWTPWVYLLAVYNSRLFLRACIFFSEEQLKTPDQKGLRIAPLPNTSQRGSRRPGTICFGDYYPRSRVAARMLFDRFWGSLFTGEISCNESLVPASIKARGWGILTKWNALTRKGAKLSGFRPVVSNNGTQVLSLNEAAVIASKAIY
jgi:hypothetical protein